MTGWLFVAMLIAWVFYSVVKIEEHERRLKVIEGRGLNMIRAARETDGPTGDMDRL